MKILVYDTECNSLDTEKGYVMELAWAVYDVDTKRCLKAESYLINWPMPYHVDEGAFAANNLSQEFCNKNGENVLNVFLNFDTDCSEVDYICGHNVLNYDLPMMISNFKRAMPYLDTDKSFEGIESHFMKKPVIDTFVDVNYLSHIKMQSLKYLAFDHGYFLNGAHEALNDVFATAHLLFSYNIHETIENSKHDFVDVKLKVPYGHLCMTTVKKAKFRWDADNKLWVHRMRRNKFDNIKPELTNDIIFHVEPVNKKSIYAQLRM